MGAYGSPELHPALRDSEYDRLQQLKWKYCEKCGHKFLETEKACPKCGYKPKPKRSGWTVFWAAWALAQAVFWGCLMCIAMLQSDDPSPTVSPTVLPTVTQPYANEPPSGMTIGQKNALQSAKNYLSFSAFSYDGLIHQLEYEKYSHEDAVFAADNCGADWFEQAAKSAKNYLGFTAFSKDGLIDQLMYEGFTMEQAEYGAKANGY